MSNKKVTDRDYLFLSTMLRARENSMLNQERTQRLLDAGSFSEAAKALTELGYPDMSGMDAEGVDACLSARRAELFAELQQLAPEKSLTDIFRLKYDYHNAKVLVKAQAADVNGERLLSDAGTVGKLALIDAFNDGDYRFIPENLGKSIQEAVSLLARTENPQSADFLLDKAYFSRLTELAADVSDKFLGEYVRVLIDSANMRSAVRTLRMGRSAEFLKSALIPGGTVDIQRITEKFSDTDGLTELFGSTALSSAAWLGQSAASGGSLMEFERECDNAVTASFDTVRRQSFGVGPVASYIHAFENELTTVRMILTGKLSGLSSDVIKERLRKSYV